MRKHEGIEPRYERFTVGADVVNITEGHIRGAEGHGPREPIGVEDRGTSLDWAMGMDPLGDQRACAGEALLPDLAPQTGLIRTALRQTGPGKVRKIRINFPGTTVATLIGWQGPRPKPVTDGVP